MITKDIKDVFQDYEETLLFATDVGSRSLGVANGNSDYDGKGFHIRSKKQLFDFTYRPNKISKLSENLDFISFDIDHFFELLNNNNPSAFDMVRSDSILVNELPSQDDFRENVIKYFDFPSLAKGFYGHAKGNVMSLKIDTMDYKMSYLAIRPLLTCELLNKEELPSYSFESLLNQSGIENPLSNIGRDFIERKKQGLEKSILPKDEAIYIKELLSNSLSNINVDMKRKADMLPMEKYLKEFNYSLKTIFYGL